MAVKTNEMGRPVHFCQTCGEETPFIHTGTSCLEGFSGCGWMVISVHEANGAMLYAAPNCLDDWENLTCRCAVCGEGMDGEEFCAIACNQ